MIAIGNSGDETLVPVAKAALRSSSPLVRGAAVWALSRLVARDAMGALAREHVADELDADVRAEWRDASIEA